MMMAKDFDPLTIIKIIYKQENNLPLYLHEVVLRSAYILFFPNSTCEILLDIL